MGNHSFRLFASIVAGISRNSRNRSLVRRSCPGSALKRLTLIVLIGFASSLQAANVGYYDIKIKKGEPDQEAPIIAAGHTPVFIDEPCAAELAGIDALFIQNSSNSSYSQEFLDCVADIDAWVLAGGNFLFHNRFVEGSHTVIPGGFDITFVVNSGDNHNVDVLDDSTLVTNGPGGIITDTTLDDGGSSVDGYAVAATIPSDLPIGAIKTLSRSNPDEIVTFSYAYGDGCVLVSTIALSQFLKPSRKPPEFREVYAPNVVAFGTSDEQCREGVDPPDLDFGDAPEPYPVLLADDGARHTIGPLFLGIFIDAEADGQPSVDADADDLDFTDNDEDGATFSNLVIGSSNAQLSVTTSAAGGRVDAWMDMDGDGDWSGVSDQIVFDEEIATTSEDIAFTIPGTITAKDTVARVRLSSAGGLNFDGEAVDGEVEDYLVTLELPTISIDDVSANEGDSLSFTVTLSTAVSQDVSFTATTADGSATIADNDYTAVSAPFTITGGTTTVNVNVPTIADTKFEGDENLTVTLTAATGATILDDSGIGTILNDDDAPTVQFDAAGQSIGEGDGPTNILVTLSNASTMAVTVPFTLSGTADTPDDYSVSPTSVTIPAGDTSTILVFTPVDDGLDEDDETGILTLGTPTNAALGIQITHTVTITDNDPPPTVSFALISSSVAEGAGTHTLVVNLSAASAKQVSVPFSVTGGTAITPDDYAVTTGSPLVIPAGGTSTNIQLTIAADALDEPDETAEFTLGAPTNATLGAIPTHTVTILDATDAPTVSFTSAAQNVAEGSGGVATVQLSAPSAQNVTVSFNVVDGTATTPADYSVVTASPVVIPAGMTTVPINLTTVADGLDEPNETMSLVLTGATNAGVGSPDTHTVTILDGDDAPTVSFTTSAQDVAEGSGATATLQLSAASTFDVQVTFGVVGGTATDPADYSVTTLSPVTIPAGSTTAPVNLTTVADGLDEPDETVPLVISGATNATVGSPDTHTVTILDGDDAPTVSFTTSAQDVAEGSGATATLQLSAISSFDVEVTFGVVGGTASDPADYSVTTLSPVTIPAGSTTAPINLTTVADGLDELDETVPLVISGATNATVGSPDTHTVTILDADDGPAVSFTTTGQDVAEGSPAVATLQLSAASTFDVQVTFGVVGGTATNPDDYSVVTASPVTIPAGSTTAPINLTTVADGLDELDETVPLVISSATNATVGSPDTHTVTILDGDDAPVVSFSSAGQNVAEGSGTSALLILSAASSFDVQVSFSVIGGTATSPDDYSVTTSSPVTIPAGMTSVPVSLTTVSDGLDEPNETVPLVISSATNATVGSPDTHTVTILDADEGPVVSFTTTAQDVAEGSGATATLQLSTISSFDVQVSFSVVGGTAADPADYSVTTLSPVTIPAGSTTAPINLTTVADGVDELDETVPLVISSATNATVGAPDTHTVTILDTDEPPTVSFVPASQDVNEPDGPAFATLVLSQISGDDVIVNFTIGGTATDPDDYNVVQMGQVTIPAGSNMADITINIVDDILNEDDETVILTITTIIGAVAGDDPVHTLTIIDDEFGTFPGIACGRVPAPTESCLGIQQATINLKPGTGVIFDWRGSLADEDLGDPTDDTGHVVCIYRDDVLLKQYQIVAGKGWRKRAHDTRFKGKDGLSDKVELLEFQASLDDAKGEMYTFEDAPVPAIPVLPEHSLKVQTLNDAGMCLEAEFLAPLNEDTDVRTQSECNGNCTNLQQE